MHERNAEHLGYTSTHTLFFWNFTLAKLICMLRQQHYATFRNVCMEWWETVVKTFQILAYVCLLMSFLILLHQYVSGGVWFQISDIHHETFSIALFSLGLGILIGSIDRTKKGWFQSSVHACMTFFLRMLEMFNNLSKNYRFQVIYRLDDIHHLRRRIKF